MVSGLAGAIDASFTTASHAEAPARPSRAIPVVLACPSMNFFAHALIAARRREEPAWILGSMLPDLASMAGLRLTGVAVPGRFSPLLGEGVDFHHTCDDAFHGAPIFVELMDSAHAELEARGLGSGPAMAIGHVGVELLLDGCLVTRHGVPVYYREAMELASVASDDLHWHPGTSGAAHEHPQRWQALCKRLRGAPVPEGYADPSFVADRLIQILARRPMLAVEPGNEPEVHAWAKRWVAKVAARELALLDQVEDRLARARS